MESILKFLDETVTRVRGRRPLISDYNSKTSLYKRLKDKRCLKTSST